MDYVTSLAIPTPSETQLEVAKNLYRKNKIPLYNILFARV